MPPKKRSQPSKPKPSTKVTQDAPQVDTSHSILGGMKEGSGTFKSRLSGSEDNTYTIPFEDGKSIVAQRYDTPSSKPTTSPSLIFTHGAGGGISNPATASFMTGFATLSPGVCFQGTMNLQSRVKTFHAVIEHELANTSTTTWKEGTTDTVALGGRSMGARAAVIASTETTSVTATAGSSSKKKKKDQKSEKRKPLLILVSYPLLGANGSTRDQILLDTSPDSDVLFVSGSDDHMCPLKRLEEVRKKMKARTWLLAVAGADHGMSLKRRSKDDVAAVREETGRRAAEWVEERRKEQTAKGKEEEEGWTRWIEWDEKKGKCVEVNRLFGGMTQSKKKGERKSEEIDQVSNGPPAKRRKKV